MTSISEAPRQSGLGVNAEKVREFDGSLRKPYILHKQKSLYRHRGKIQEYVQENVLRASLLATVCFYRNLAACLQHEMSRVQAQAPFFVETDGRMLRLLLELSRGELAADNMPGATQLEPHYCAMLRAAQFAGIPTARLEELVLGTSSLSEGFEPAAVEYMTFSAHCCESFKDAFATIALRELTLAESFKRIAANFPRMRKYEPFLGFVEAHIELDEDDHAILMTKALELLDNLDGVMEIMLEFYTRRARLYDACLDERPLY